MRPRSRCLVVALLATLGCSTQPPVAVQTDSTATSPTSSLPQIPGERFGDFVVGEPLHFGNLTIFPISSLQPQLEDRFITLDEGLAQGTVNIVEVGAETELTGDARGEPASPPTEADDTDPFGDAELAGAEVQRPDGADGDEAEVNRLMIINTSSKPLYLLPGEVISGGQQDRTIGEELVIQPGDKPTAIEAYCVEHGRWSDRDLGHTAQLLAELHASGGAVAGLGGTVTEIGGATNGPDESALAVAAAEANRGKFVASAGALGKAARVAVQAARDQGQVWDEVGEVNHKAGNDLASDNFTGNYANPQITDRLAPYIEGLQRPVQERAQVVGVVVAVNGEVQTVDVFESTPLFQKFWPKLLRSYALDALTSQATENAEAPAEMVCTLEKCLAALRQLEEAAVGTEELDGGLVQVKRESKHIVSFSISDKSADEAMSGGMGGLGGSIHGGGFF